VHISLPELSLVVLIGASGAGKSTFARKHFLPTEVLSSDFCRALVSDNDNDMAATNDAFAVLHFIAARRLAAGRLTVVDATNVQAESRKPLVALAREYHCLPVAIVLNLPERLCQDRNRARPDRDFGPHVARQHIQQLRRSLKGLGREGFRHVFVLSSVEEIEAVEITREPLYNDKRGEHGPFDVIGDIHGCADELEQLLAALGYIVTAERSDGSPWDGPVYAHPAGRKAIFLGDLVDRGPRVVDTVRLVRNMVEAGHALCVPGNHDMKLMRKLQGRDVQVTHGLDASLGQIEALPGEERERFIPEALQFLDSLVSHYVLDSGKLVVAHAGMRQEMQGRGSGSVRAFALYGETTGETDEMGLPVRSNWAADYRGQALVIYGHTPVPGPEWLNGTINIDTGCVFGGRLTALRYPERELVSVPANHTYYMPVRPFLEPVRPGLPAEEHAPLSAQQQHDDVLDLDDVLGKRLVQTRLAYSVTIREENAIPALEVMTRFAADPRWLIYLPPAIAPCETSARPDLLEHPAEAFAYYRTQGVATVVCEEKHMGSRAVVVICRDAAAAQARFGAVDGAGIVYTRTGRRFFDDRSLELDLLARLRQALTAANVWERLETEWVCLDCELMPWSAKAQELIRHQYAAVGAAAHAGLTATHAALAQAATRGLEVDQELLRETDRLALADRFVAAYQHYCWPAASIADYKLAPFHLLASENRVHIDQDHRWHMTTLAEICEHDPEVLLATPFQVVDLSDPLSEQAAVGWWEALTERGGEGMVVKPLSFIARGRRGLVQPAVKCRGREYLRIIYGPEYSLPENMERLRKRGLSLKRSLAQREFALGIEALERFVRKEPLRRVHECVFGVLALESEPVDPRL